MVKYKIVPQKTAVVVVDMQNDFVKPGAPVEVADARAMIPRLNQLLDLCRDKGISVIYIRHVLRGDGSDVGRLGDIHPYIREGRALCVGTENVEIYEDIQPKPGDLIVVKSRYSAFHGTDLEAILRTREIDTIILAGTVTNTCCESTARDAFSRDYKLIFLSDGCATHDWPDIGWGRVTAEEAQRVALTVVASCFGQVASIAEVMDEIRG
ncbi:MAG: cysteine hydrolase [Chloroflexi bacterium]|nr:cysteine hydrolase [Chloroflexota bacterium]